jgi:hypothetical protein
LIRALLSVAAGIALAFVGIALIQSIGHQMYPPPEGIDPTDREAFAEIVAQMPVGTLLMVLLAYGLGTFAGAWLAARLAGRWFYAMLVGGVMMLAGVSNLVAIPHPWWFTVLGIVTFLPCAYLGGRLAATS